MSRTVWKFPLKPHYSQSVAMPDGAIVLSVQFQDESLCLWALVESTATLVDREIRIAGTGIALADADECYFVGTAQIGALVFHVFERVVPSL